MVVVGYGQIIPQSIIDIPPLGDEISGSRHFVAPVTGSTAIMEPSVGC